MTNDRNIEILSWAHGGAMVIISLWPWLHLPSYPVKHAETDVWSLRSVSAITFVIGAILMWTAHRGMVDKAMRLVATCVAIIAGVHGLHPVLEEDAGAIDWVVPVVHLGFGATWCIMLLLSDSPYRPRPVLEMKREREKTG